MTASARPHQLTRITIGDSADAWAGADFAVQVRPDGAEVVVLGQTALALVGGDERGIRGLGVAGTDCEELAIFDHGDLSAAAGVEHANGVASIDHVVMLAGDCDATTSSLTAAGFEARRVRRFGPPDAARRQTFFWMGDVILELVGPDEALPNPEPPSLWGLALNCPDLDATVAALGPDRCSDARDAVQPGRRIATMRTKSIGISVAVALMSPHPSD